MHEINMRILTTLERGSYALNAVFSATVGVSVDFPGNLDHKCGLPDDGTHQPLLQPGEAALEAIHIFCSLLELKPPQELARVPPKLYQAPSYLEAFVSYMSPVMESYV